MRLARERPRIEDLPPASGIPLTIVIPARNEAIQVETVVRSILASNYQPLEVIVVDDRSTDDTAAIVRRIAAEDGRLRLIEGEPLPAGWYGKPWACQQGANGSSSELILFTDADTIHAPGLHGHAVAALLAAKADLLTVAPRQLVVGFWERVIMPQVWVMLGLRFHPDVVNKARRPRDVIANGQFMLFRRATYDALGGHASVRGDVVEDLAFGRRVAASGRTLRFMFAYESMQTRMYRSLREIIEGWSKNLYIGGRLSYSEEPLLRALAPFGMMLHEAFWLLPPLVLIAGLAGLTPALLAPAAIATGLGVLFWGLVALGMMAPLWYGLLYPVGAAMTLYILVRSMRRGRRQVEWRGRVYDETTGTMRERGPVSGP